MDNTIFKSWKYHKILTIVFITAFSIIGRPQMSWPQMTPPETVDYVDVARYTGLWYQIASYINPNIGDLAGVTAEYSLNDDGTVRVVNRGLVGGLDGTPVMIEGIARVVDPETNAKLAVSFPEFGITEESEYWIIELGEYYSYAVVTNSQRSSLFILNRRPTMDDATYEGIIDRLTKNGFDPEQIVKTVQIEDAEMPPPETVESVDLESYAGLWYEYARYDTFFDEDVEEVTAEYTRNDDGTVKVVNRGLRPDGNPTFIEGVARVVDPETNAKLAVTFDREDLAGIEFDYWIIELDEAYQWAVVTNATRVVLYILSRTPALDDDVYEDILYRVVQKGFEADRLELTPQPECIIDVVQEKVLRSRWSPSVALITIKGTDTDWFGGLVRDNFEITYSAEKSRELFWLPGTFPFLNERTQTINQLIILLPAWFTACCFDGSAEIMTVEVCNTQTGCCAEDEVAITMLPFGLEQ